MNLYDARRTPFYEPLIPSPEDCANQTILQWWESAHDCAIAKQIEKDQWVWYWGIVDELVAITPSDTLKIWQMVDPQCAEGNWYNVLRDFAISRADALKLTAAIRKPEWKVCAFCNEEFLEDSLSYPLVKRLGVDQLDFCFPCLAAILYDEGLDSASREEVLSFLRNLAAISGRVPPSCFGEGVVDLKAMTTEERLAALSVLDRRPSLRRVKELFGSWLGALIEAGLLDGGARRTSRGTQCLARDGHVCLSLGEKTIDDLLYGLGIAHEREVPYPEGNFRADFAVGDVLVEYLGLSGDPAYDARSKAKQAICARHRLRLVLLYPLDLVNSKRLEEKILNLCPKALGESEGGIAGKGALA